MGTPRNRQSKRIRKWIGLGLLLATGGCSGTPSTPKGDEKALYALGQMMARKVDSVPLSEKDVDILVQGFRDWTLRHESKFDYDTTKGMIQDFMDRREMIASKREKEKGDSYLEKFVKSGATRSQTGLAYKILRAGSIVRPRPIDSVEVLYHGTFPDGRVFDSSLERKEKGVFPLNSVIPAWAEALQLIGEGGEIEVVVPSELAYGFKGSPPQIPGGATLVFKIQLFRVIRGN